jgi:hypothetical protein
MKNAKVWSRLDANKVEVEVFIPDPLPLPTDADDPIINIARMPMVKAPTVDTIRAGVGDWKFPFRELSIPKKGGRLSNGCPAGNCGFLFNGCQDKAVVVLGDSHADFFSHRFVFKKEKADAAGRPFPSVFFATNEGQPTFPCYQSDIYPANLAMIKRDKPNVVLIDVYWTTVMKFTLGTAAK